MLMVAAIWLSSTVYGQTINKAEYFLDTDPGVGMGMPVSITSAGTIDQNFSVNTSGFSAGLHRLYIRAQQSDGLWSIPKTRFFYVSDNNNTKTIQFATDIVAAEYFYDTDPGVGKGAKIPLQKSATIDKNWVAKTDGLTEGDHYLYIRTQSQDGFWGMPDTVSIYIDSTIVCQVPSVDFDFNTVDINTNIGITDLSTNVDGGATYAWDVNDDGTVDGNSATFDTQFATRGVYSIRLTVTNSDGCSASVLKDVFVTSGISKAITLSANDSLIAGNSLDLTAPAGYTYEWSTGETSQTLSVSKAGSYYVFLSADGITFKSDIVQIKTFEALTADFSSFNATSGLSNGAAIVENIKSDELPFTISWSTGASQVRSLTGLAPGSYSLTITTPLDTYNFPFTVSDITPANNSIIEAEYFIGTDPGVGNGTAIDIYQAGTLNIGFNVDASSLSTGLYKLYTRVKQASGIWSIPKYRHFYVIDPNARVYEEKDLNLISAEYFFDNDPGVGNGTTVPVFATKIADINFSHTISTLSSGLHDLYIRTQQDDGMWSLAEPVTFFVIGGRFEEIIEFKTDIVEAEYFFDHDPGVGNGKAMPIQKSAQLDNRPWAAPTAGLSQGEHTLNIRTKNQDGIWNVVSAQTFTINDKACLPPIADFAFDTVGVDTMVGLVDLSTGLSDSVTYAWDIYGDGSIESTRADFDTTFSANGVYPIKLTVVNFPDSCFTSVVKDIIITDGLTAAITANKLDTLLVGDSITYTAPAGYAYEWNNGATTQSITVGKTGTYYAWLEADGISFKSQAKTVAFFKEITANISVSGASIGLSNGSASVTNISTDGLPYNIVWTNGATGQTQVNELATGNYQVEINTILDTITFTFNIGEINLAGTEILKAEYFFGADPGPGNGMEIVTYQADKVSFDFIPDISGLDIGLQRLYIRAQQANGIWGIPKVRFFYIIDPNARAYVEIDNNLISAEYFIDEDPGAGNGSPIAITEAKTADQNFNLLADNFNPGLHTIYVRTKQTDGNWSIPSRTKFFVIDTAKADLVVFNTDIVAAEYYFDKDPGIGKGFSIPIQKTDTLTNRPWSASTSGLDVGKHQLNIRVQNQDGLWNPISSTEVFIYPSDCDFPIADFSFDTVGINTPIALTDLSSNVLTGATYKWDIDGDEVYESTDPAYNPTFGANGVYPIRLTVQNTEGCATSIVKDILIVDGLPGALVINGNDSLLVGDTLKITAPSGYAYEWINRKKSQEISVTKSGNYYAYLTKDSISFKSEVITVKFFNPITASIVSFDATNGSNGAARIEALSHDKLPISITWSNGASNVNEISDLAPGSYSVTLSTSLETTTLNFDILSGTAASNSLISLEYFLDSDPGPGLGTPVSIYENPSVQITRPIVMSSVGEGAHTVYFRAKKDDGLWGFPVPKKFYIIPADGGLINLAFGGDIVYAEYAFDSLPSLGLGVPINITSGLSLDESLAVDITNLAAGDHSLFLQMQDASGNWSFSEAEPFVICTNVPSAPLVNDVTECYGADFVLNISADSGNNINIFDSTYQLITTQTAATYTFAGLTESQVVYVSQSAPDGCESVRTAVNLNVTNVQAFAGPDIKLPVARTYSFLDDNFPKGGTWSGSTYVTSDGVFSPKDAGLGDYTLTYTLDSAGCTLTDNMTVMVREITSGIPKVSNQIFTLNENTPENTSLGTIVATDSDGDTLKFYGANPTDTLYISIDSLSGEMFVKDSSYFDFEMVDSLGITVKVLDEFYEVEAFISFLIQNVNEAPVVVNQIFAVNENSLNGVVIDTAQATDPEFDAITYSILSGNELGTFTLTSEGVLSVIDSTALDFETNPSLLLLAEASDGLLNTQFSIEVSLINENESPEISNQSFIINENSSVNSFIGSIAALDLDGDALSFAGLTASDSLYVSIHPSTGEISVKDSSFFDYETINLLDINVVVSDGVLEASASISIVVEDVNEQPLISDQTYSINENSAVGFKIDTLIASDPEAQSLSYTILSGNELGGFALTTDGVLSVADTSVLDFELNPSFTLLVQVSDGTLSTPFTLEIDILDVNEAPVVSDQSYTIAENTEVNSFIGQIIASDFEGDALTYIGLTADDSLYVSIHPSTGAISVKDSSFFDFETTNMLDINVVVSDGMLDAFAVISIVIENVNEQPIIASQTYSIDENSANAIKIDTLIAIDPESQTLTYGILSGNELGGFALATNGVLSVADSSVLDFEASSSFIISAQVSDGALNTPFTIEINILDVNEAPILIGQSLTISENSPSSTLVGSLNAVDPENDVLTYSILSGNGLGAFSIDTNGALIIADSSALDFEINPSFNLAIQVSDGFLQAQANFSITILDVVEVVSEEDLLLVTEFYNSTNGDNWANNSGWLSEEPIGNWYGITVDGDKIIKIDLRNNNLVGTVPNSALDISYLDTLLLSGNSLTDLPPLNEIPGIKLLDISQNLLSFSVFEEFSSADNTVYSPQRPLLEEVNILAQLNDVVTLNRAIPGQQLSYSWFKNGQTYAGTGPSIQVTAESFAAEGKYTVQVTSALIPNLSINSKSINLKVSSLERDSTVLVALYDSLGGDSWTKKANWKTGKVTDWEGVQFVENRLVGINFADNNLAGVVPEEINDALELINVDLSGNQITGLPKITLTGQTTFNVSNNRLDFADLIPNVGVDGIQYNNQKALDPPTTESLSVGSPFTLSYKVAGQGNQYAWTKNELAITGANTDTYTVEAIGYSTMGVYQLSVSNPSVPNLIIRSGVRTMWATANLEVSSIFDFADGTPGILQEGEGYLFRIKAKGPYDTIQNFPKIVNEKLIFNNVRLGDYILSVKTTKGYSQTNGGDVVQFMQTYYESTIDNIEADVLELRDHESLELVIQRLPPPFTGGDGEVEVLVESDFTEETQNGSGDGRVDSRRKVKKAVVSMRRFVRAGRLDESAQDEWQLVAYLETDDEGKVSFEGVPTGRYRINIQYPGIPMDPNSFVEFEITDDKEEDGFVLEATVTEEGIFVVLIEELGFYLDYFKNLNVYPNPADKVLNISYDKLFSDNVKVIMTTIDGKKVKELEINRGYGGSALIETDNLMEGIYLLRFVDTANPGRVIAYLKVIVRH